MISTFQIAPSQKGLRKPKLAEAFSIGYNNSCQEFFFIPMRFSVF